LELKCTLCSYLKRFHTSPIAENQLDVEKKKPFDKTKTKKKCTVSIKPFEVNLRAVIAMREIGAGHESMKTFSLYMNMHCLTPNGYNRIKRSALNAYKAAAEKSMLRAALEAKPVNDSAGLKQARVLIDGSWQKR